uniref:Uncharacterized protein n=1 Tax=Caulerpa okamurae TaxID=118247 RepID=A0A3S6I2J4_9CHLO|nr:hypothetical protein [Caulerpa okamurae]
MKIQKFQKWWALFAFMGTFFSLTFFYRQPVVKTEKFPTSEVARVFEKENTWLDNTKSKIYDTYIDMEPLGQVSRFTEEPNPVSTGKPGENSQEIYSATKKLKKKSKSKKLKQKELEGKLIRNISIALFILYILGVLPSD